MCLDLRHSLGWLVPVALCGTEVAYRGCSGLDGTGPALGTGQPTSSELTHTRTHLYTVNLTGLMFHLTQHPAQMIIWLYVFATGSRTCHLFKLNFSVFQLRIWLPDEIKKKNNQSRQLIYLTAVLCLTVWLQRLFTYSTIDSSVWIIFLGNKSQNYLISAS